MYFVKLPSPLHSPTPRFTRSLRALLVPPPNQGGSHIWIPAIISLGSEVQRHTSSPVHPPHFIFLTSISESAFCPKSFHGAHHLQGQLQTLLSEFSPVHGPPEVNPSNLSSHLFFPPNDNGAVTPHTNTHTQTHTHTHTQRKWAI